MEIKKSDLLKQRISRLKPLPPRYMKQYVVAYPEENNLYGIDKVRDVVNLRRADEDITNKLERLFKKTRKKNADTL